MLRLVEHQDRSLMIVEPPYQLWAACLKTRKREINVYLA